jgi:lipopolysaccharide heptosyltransferase II
MPSSRSQRILVRGTNWLGDAVMSTSALLRLREARPDDHITLLTHAKLKELWQGHPAVDAVQTFAEDETAWSIGRRLRPQKFDLGLVLPNSPRSALELWLAGIPQRIGYARPWRNWFLTRAIPSRAEAVPMHKRSPEEINRLIHQGAVATPPASGAHHIYQYLHLTSALGAKPEALPPQLVVTEAALAQFVSKFRLAICSPDPPLWFGLNAGAEYGPAKRWPEQSFIQAAIEIQRRTKCRWLVFGLKTEKESALRITTSIYRAAGQQFGWEKMADDPWVVNLAGTTSLGELCAALKLCRILLTNDSGPMHVAAALGTPVVVPFGSTSPELTGPGLPGDARHQLLRANAPCSPCFLRECPIDFRCLTGISVERVVQAALKAAD